MKIGPERKKIEIVLLPFVPRGKECGKEHGKVIFLTNQSFLNISCSKERQKDSVTTSFFEAHKILTLSPLGGLN